MSRRGPSEALSLPFDSAWAGPLRDAGPDPLAAAFTAHAARMHRAALRITRDAAAAEDAVASALEKALRHRHAFRGDAKPSTWLHRIVVNEALAWRRSETRRARHTQAAGDTEATRPAAAPNPLDALLLRERRDETLGALARLRPADRELLVRAALDGRYADLSPELAPATVKMRVFRARRALRASLDDGRGQQQPASEHGPRVSR
jgi:RNA polymerase sigma-70 factor (ECF subfamily)